MQEKTNNNSAEFILDGSDFFAELGKLIDMLLETEPDQSKCYLRLAYWQISQNAIIPANDNRGEVRLIDLLAALALKGHNVQIIAWAGTNVANMFVNEMKSNWSFKKWLDKLNAVNKNVIGFRAIQLYMEKYGNVTNVATSTHQKITIVNTGHQRFALVGGENMTDSYLSSKQHNASNWWHDTAVKVQGPITKVIDTEFVRRWNKSTNHNQPAPQALEGESDVGDKTITMLTTNTEATPKEQSIRDRLIQCIEQTPASGTIYMENYALTDPGILNTLTKKIAQDPEINLVVLVNHPQNESVSGFASFSYLMYYTYISLHANVINTVSVWSSLVNYLLSKTTTLNESYLHNIEVENPFTEQAALAWFNPDSAYKIGFTNAQGSKQQYKFASIANLKSMKNFMYSPVFAQSTQPAQYPYPHSKLAIINKQHTFIGSSNWTYRSMQYDGEIMLEIDNSDFAEQVANKLYTHWNQPSDLSEWAEQATQNKKAIVEKQTPIGQLKIVPLHYDDFINPNSSQWRSYAAYAGWLGSAYF